MSTLVLQPNNNFEEITSIMRKKFGPKLKTEEDSVYFSENNNQLEEQNKNLELASDINALNKMRFLFPSIPIKNIENIFKANRNLSIEEGIEQLKELTLTENTKKKLEQKNYYNSKKFQKSIPIKRNYNFLINNNKIISQKNIISNYSNNNNNIYIHTTNNTNNSSNIISNNNDTLINAHEKILYQEKLEKEKEIERQKEEERMKERKKVELKTVDKVAQELLESKNQTELKEYLLNQLILLDQKKRIDYNNEQIIKKINHSINQLNNDNLDLRKCNIAVTRALNKKAVECFNLENKKKKLENEINNVEKSINYHAYMGDLYNEKIKLLKENNYEEL